MVVADTTILMVDTTNLLLSPMKVGAIRVGVEVEVEESQVEVRSGRTRRSSRTGVSLGPGYQ